MSFYPSFHRLGPVCIKRESARTGKKVNISEVTETKGVVDIVLPDKESFDRMVGQMEVVSWDTFDRYLVLLNKREEQNAVATFRETHKEVPAFYEQDNARIRKAY